jgi:hypothetical protein
MDRNDDRRERRKRDLAWAAWGICLALLFALALAVLAGHAHAGKRGTWSDAPQFVRDWLSTQTQPGTGISCCGIGDAVNVEIVGAAGDGFRLRVVNGRGYLPEGMMLVAGRDRVVRVNFDADGRAVAWVSPSGTVYCLAPEPRV